jgi:hypothetical protein
MCHKEKPRRSGAKSSVCSAYSGQPWGGNGGAGPSRSPPSTSHIAPGQDVTGITVCRNSYLGDGHYSAASRVDACLISNHLEDLGLFAGSEIRTKVPNRTRQRLCALFDISVPAQGYTMTVGPERICRTCGQGMHIVADIAPFGGTPGLRAFLCEGCGATDSDLTLGTIRSIDLPRAGPPRVQARSRGQ